MRRVGYLAALAGAPTSGAVRQVLTPRRRLFADEPALPATAPLPAPRTRAPLPRTAGRTVRPAVPDEESGRADDAAARTGPAPLAETERPDPPAGLPHAAPAPAAPRPVGRAEVGRVEAVREPAAVAADDRTDPWRELEPSRPRPRARATRTEPRPAPVEPPEQSPVDARDRAPEPRLRIGTIDVTVVAPPPAPPPTAPRRREPVTAAPGTGSAAAPLSRGGERWFGLAQR